LGAGGALQVLADPTPSVAAYLRTSAADKESVLVVLNFGTTQANDLNFDLNMQSPEILWGSGMIEMDPSRTGHLRISKLAPGTGMWIRL
jgi:hypothetical protein